MKFKTWIKQFRGTNSPIGDLADDIANDKSFPNSNSYCVLSDYLDNTDAFSTFQEVWKYYKGDVYH